MLAVFGAFLGFRLGQNQDEDKHMVIAYVMGGRSTVNAEDAMKITHINYAFADVVDGRVVEISDKDGERMQELVKLKSHNPDLKILISVGGWSRSKGFSDAVLTEASREIFAQSCIAFMHKHHLDGVDLDWEYPALRGDNNVFRKEDTENFTAALKLIKEKLDIEGKRHEMNYLLTIATGASQNYLDHVQMDMIHQYLDFINIMTYDYKVGSSKIAGPHTNLYPSLSEGVESKRSSANAVEEHVKAGAPIEKLNLGVAFYGRGWTKVERRNNGLYSKVEGKGFSLSFHAISDSLSLSDYSRYWDKDAKAPYLWNSKASTFIGYDDEESLREKSKYIKEKGLGGVMFWEYSGDNNGVLLETLHSNLNE